MEDLEISLPHSDSLIVLYIFQEACAVGRKVGRVKRRVRDVYEGRKEGREHKVTIEAFISEK